MCAFFCREEQEVDTQYPASPVLDSFHHPPLKLLQTRMLLGRRPLLEPTLQDMLLTTKLAEEDKACRHAEKWKSKSTTKMGN